MITPPVGGAYASAAFKNLVRLILFTVAALTSASLVGCLCGYLGSLLSSHHLLQIIIWTSIAVATVAYGIAEMFKARWRVPTRHWLIPRRWGVYGSPAFEIIFGGILGAGFFTVIPFIGYHVLIMICIVKADPLGGAFIMGTFGAARAIPVVLAPLTFLVRKQAYTVETACQVNGRFILLSRKLRYARVVILFGIAGTALSLVS